MAAQNALELIQAGRLTEPYSAPFQVVHTGTHFRLRRYQGTLAAQPETTSPLVLVPPLMLTAEIYDMAPESSVVGALARDGVDAWVVDFGAPESEEGGMSRTLDDHVKGVSAAIDAARDITGKDVHLAGYSQGGMFAYQTAAYRKSEGIASVITFGSPINIHRTVPNLRDDVTARVVEVLRNLLGGPLDRVEGLPGFLTSTGFKLLSARKEVQQFIDFIRKLHDRQELERREAKRLFLRGDGFVAWPGPAFRSFVDEFVVANRMTTGGFVVDGTPVTLADIRVPVLCFIGERDDMAPPASVRAIHRAAPLADISEVSVKAGHFGLVVGSEAFRRTWPTVGRWIRWRDGVGLRPAAIPRDKPYVQYDPEDLETIDDSPLDVELTVDVLRKTAQAAMGRIGDGIKNLGTALGQLRNQVPRLSRLQAIGPSTRVSIGKALQEQADEFPEGTFFLWRGRAFSYEVANQRVDNIVRGPIACGAAPYQRIGLLMKGRPSFLSALAALNRMGAVGVLLDPRASDRALKRAFAASDMTALIVDPENAERGSGLFDGPIWVLGGGRERRELGQGLLDMESIDPEAVKMPGWYSPNPGRASDLALIIMTGGGDSSRTLKVTNHRWAFAAIGAAATANLTSKDTVYSCLPLHHATTTLVSVGSALIGGSRLALGTELSPENFWSEVRQYGATVVFYAGEMCRQLVDAPLSSAENKHPIRLFAGSGMRKDVWERLVDRFGPLGILEFYAATESNAVLANASGEKVGAIGQPMPGSRDFAIVSYDFERGEIRRNRRGFCTASSIDEAGMLLTRLEREDLEILSAARVVRDVFEAADTWYSTGSIVRQDVDGDHWFVDRESDLIVTPTGRVASRPIEDALYRWPAVRLAAAYGVSVEGQDQIHACVVLGEGQEVDAAELSAAVAQLPAPTRPHAIFVVDRIAMTDGYRPLKSLLRQHGNAPLGVRHRFVLQGDGDYRLDAAQSHLSVVGPPERDA